MSRRRRQQDMENSSQEARQEHEHVQDQNEEEPMSEQSGQDLLQNQDRDYQLMPHQDVYEKDGIDDQQYQDDPDARRRAERQMNRQQRQRRQEGDQIDELFEDESDDLRVRQRRTIFFADDIDEQVDQQRFLDAQDVKGKLSEWIKQDQTVKYIKVKFSKFLKLYKGDQNFPIYASRLRDMCTSNRQSIQIDYDHLKNSLPVIALWVGLEPSIIIPYLNLIAYSIACKHYTSYKDIFPQVFVKIVNLPIVDNIRDLRHIHLRKLIRIHGVITIRSEVFNQLKKIFYKCAKCGHQKGPFFFNDVNSNKVSLGNCASCQSTGPFFVDKQRTVYRNHQKITVQQSPSEVLPGRIPRQKEVYLFGDDIDAARPGDQVQITGVYMHRYQTSLNAKQGFPLFATLIEANVIRRLIDERTKKTDQSRQLQFRKFASDPNIQQIIFNSIAPSIYGHQRVKQALTMAMFGGQQRTVESHKVRGDINVLLLGDPGVAKSQFLKSVQKVFHRCVYTTGKGASAVGLTASVKKDFATNQWRLQAGALVLADRGICLIDEFDKMNQNDRTSIHEAMEQQSISISKAGIVTSLRARCSVIAAANPVQGRYNPTLQFKDNVDLSDPILSRFDILCVVRDQVNQEIDHDLSTFVLNSHIKNHPYNTDYDRDFSGDLLRGQRNTRPMKEPDFLKHYIRYAREKCKPSLPEKNLEIIKGFYLKLREQSKTSNGMHVATRHIESIIRIATAHARMRLRNQIKKDDIDFGIKIMLESFISTQKNNTANQLKKKFSSYL